MSKKLFEIASDLVHELASTTPMTPEEMVNALKTVFAGLQEIQKLEVEGTIIAPEIPPDVSSKLDEKMNPMDSIQNDKIICLECGAEYRQLTLKHLSAHGLTLKEYKKKYGFPLKQSLSAKSLSKARSKAAKKRGLPEELQAFQRKKKELKEQKGEQTSSGM
jgi:predicted transcriptional regulator